MSKNIMKILSGLNLEESDNILIPFKNVKKGEYIIIKDRNNSKLYLDCTIDRRVSENDYEITNISYSSQLY